ncbi:hypothetical protein EGI88_10150 [Empedobacter falsenii]|uniref:Uncharacterized protein n=1 Tax=Empedobacter falsenii TaxID=343874 RepID=A0A3R8SL06_9FLAO|nr:hypothetical protein EGI89_10050 [Empedobacter falsenii]RRT90152.1 hypothetical protein EGI88_10150 [Empedobacter falsenii]
MEQYPITESLKNSMIFDERIINKAQIMEITVYVIQYITAVGLIETTSVITLILSIMPICLQSFGKFAESWKQIGIN